MLFPTHLVAAVLLGRVSRHPVVWLVAGAALPDVVDKPLGSLGVVELYHSVGHSGLVFAAAAVALTLLGRAGAAVAAGWASHLLLDAVHVVVNGRPTDALFLAWPLTLPPDPLGIPPGEFFWYYLWSPSFFLEVLLWAGLAAVVVRRLSERPGRPDTGG